MRKIFYTLTAFLIFSFQFSISIAQSWQWGKRAGGPLKGNSPDEEVKAIATDRQGNSYMLATISTDPGIGDFRIDDIKISNGNGMQDVCLMSFDCSGKYRWSKILGGRPDDYAFNLKLDSMGGVYVSGRVYPPSFGDTVRYDKDTFLTTPLLGPRTNYKSMFIIKYDTSGKYKWVKFPEPDTMSFYGFSLSTTMDVSPNGTLSVLTYIKSRGAFAGGAYIVTSSAIIPSLHMLKYDANGNFIKGFPMDISEGNEYSLFYLRMAWDYKNDVYYTMMTNTGYYDVSYPVLYPKFGTTKMTGTNCLAKFNNTGANIWVRQSSTTYYTGTPFCTPVIDNEGNIYIGSSEGPEGKFNGYTAHNTLGGTNSVPFVVKLNSSGTNLWAYNGSASLMGKGTSLAVSLTGEVGFAGWWADKLKFDSYSANSPYHDLFFARLDAKTGALKNFDSLKSGDVSSADALVADRSGNFYMGGVFRTVLTFPGVGALNKYGGLTDLYIAKFGEADCIPTGIYESKFAASEVKIYPNPAQDFVMIEGLESGSEVHLFNILGQQLFVGITDAKTYKMSLSGMIAGMYVLQFKTSDAAVYSTKILKQ